MENKSIVGKNGVYILGEEGITIVTETKNIKDKKPVSKKLLDAIKKAIDENKE
ncbi:MAG: hypothetical protein ACLFQJ_07245 [Campylobacterales bacterium]